MDPPTPMDRRGVRWCGAGEGSGRGFVGAVGVVVVVVGNEGVKAPPIICGMGYGGPKREGRLVMQRGENREREEGK
jgi:hypothetical protein